MLLDDGADQAVRAALQARRDLGIESHNRIMHAGRCSARRSEQRAEVDPHAWQVAHYREYGQRHSEKDALPSGDGRRRPRADASNQRATSTMTTTSRTSAKGL